MSRSAARSRHRAVTRRVKLLLERMRSLHLVVLPHLDEERVACWNHARLDVERVVEHLSDPGHPHVRRRG